MPQLGRLRSEYSTSSKQQNRSKLDSLLDSYPSLFENLDSHITTNIKECSQVLSRMYNSLADPVVKLYIQNNCLHLMSLDKYSVLSVKWVICACYHYVQITQG